MTSRDELTSLEGKAAAIHTTSDALSMAWSTPFPQERAFWNDFDTDYLFELARRLSRIGAYELGFRPSGSVAGHRAGDFILEAMNSLGLQDVHKEPFPVFAWDFAGASLTLSGWEPMPASSYPPTPGTPPEGLSSLLVDAGQGLANDYLGLDVRDKIAFVRFDTQRLPWVDVLAHQAELNGARAVVFYYTSGYAQHESGEALNTHDGAARPTIPIIQVCKRDGMRVAERLATDGPLQVILYSQVEANPEGIGYNIIGKIPGRLAERYLIIGAHYDAWFHGYWDNAVGVAGILTIAKALLEQGYQPEHTLLFIATDAEEFGAADTHFDWLIGCHRLLEAHPEWHGQVSSAFNVDTLAFLAQEQLGFIGPPELLPFLRQAVGNYEAQTFPQPRPWVKEQITAWTEVLTYAYFGIPGLQPRFALEKARQTIYHTQFDTADIVHQERASETLQLYGTLLVRFDQQTFLPYDFGERVQSLRATIGTSAELEAEDVAADLKDALNRLEDQATRYKLWLSQEHETKPALAREMINDHMRQVGAHLIKHINYLNAAAPQDALPLHVFYDRDLRALDVTLAHLATGDAEQAITALTDQKTGLHGAWCALDVSYPVYYRHTVGGRNPGREDLFWGEGRTAMITDVWTELHTLKDKLSRGVTDFDAEKYALRDKRMAVAAAYRDAIDELAGTISEATIMLRDVMHRASGIEEQPL